MTRENNNYNLEKNTHAFVDLIDLKKVQHRYFETFKVEKHKIYTIKYIICDICIRLINVYFFIVYYHFFRVTVTKSD